MLLAVHRSYRCWFAVCFSLHIYLQASLNDMTRDCSHTAFFSHCHWLVKIELCCDKVIDMYVGSCATVAQSGRNLSDTLGSPRGSEPRGSRVPPACSVGAVDHWRWSFDIALHHRDDRMASASCQGGSWESGGFFVWRAQPSSKVTKAGPSGGFGSHREW